MKKTTKKKKPAAKASAARVPSLVIKSYPHVIHVYVDGAEDTSRRLLDASLEKTKRTAEKLSAEFSGAPVAVEFRDSQDKLLVTS